ncbi:MAG: hypothetical protein LBV20_03015 [Treponema sp.]|jgi:hypothetical protein|nr:hypothetical protein [Treponema sp.]
MLRKKIKGIILFPLMIVLVTGVLTSCDNFFGMFTNSLAGDMARDPAEVIPVVTADNIDDLKQTAAGNPDLQLKIMEEVAVLATNETDPVKKQKLQNDGVELAVESTNIMGTMTTMISDPVVKDLIEGGGEPNQEQITDLVSGLIDSLGNLQESTEALVATIPSDDASIEAFKKDNENTTDIALTSVLLVAADIQQITTDNPDLDFAEVFAEAVSEEGKIDLSVLEAKAPNIDLSKTELALGLIGDGSIFEELKGIFAGMMPAENE